MCCVCTFVVVVTIVCDRESTVFILSDCVVLTVAIEQCAVGSVAANQLVVAKATFQCVVAIATVQLIIAFAAANIIISVAREDEVVAAIAMNSIIAIAASLRTRSTISIEIGLVILRRDCLLYTSPSPRDRTRSRMPSSA